MIPARHAVPNEPLYPLIEAGHCLIPLRRWDAVRAIRVSQADFDEAMAADPKRTDHWEHEGRFWRADRSVRTGKQPIDSEWTTRRYPDGLDVADACRSRGLNIGVRLRATDLVVDVDPRNFPEGQTLDTPGNPLRRLCSDHGIDLKASPVVRTGSGGVHVYLSKPKEPTRVRKGLSDYPGIDFLSVGRFVVAPGSKHPDGPLYRWATDPEETMWPCAPFAPASLLRALEMPDLPPKRTTEPEFEPDEIETLLTHLPVEDFADHEEWFKLMCAVHHASGGLAREEFVEWSAGDPLYSADDELVCYRWDTLGDYDGMRAGVGTLIHYLKLHRAAHLVDRRPSIERCRDDFADEPCLTEGA